MLHEWNNEGYIWLELIKNFWFFLLSYSDPFLSTHYRRTGLVLHLITFNDTHTHSAFGRTPLDYQPDVETYTWQHTTLTTDIHASGRIRTRNPSKRAATVPRLRPRGHRDPQLLMHGPLFLSEMMANYTTNVWHLIIITAILAQFCESLVWLLRGHKGFYSGDQRPVHWCLVIRQTCNT